MPISEAAVDETSPATTPQRRRYSVAPLSALGRKARLALRVCREPAELCESLLWIRSDRVVRIHVGGANLPLPVDDVPGRQRKAIRRFPVKVIKRVAECSVQL